MADDNNTGALVKGTILRSVNFEYRIDRVLGAGSFGITYLAYAKVRIGNVTSTVPFAIKEYFTKTCYRDTDGMRMVPTPVTVDEVNLGRADFLVEARRLQHLCRLSRNIVDVNETFETNGTAYYVMEFLDGGSPGVLPEAEALQLIREVAVAVGYIHQEKVLHLDIKPDNIVMKTDDEGRTFPVLIDFGVAKHFDRSGKPTSQLSAKGASSGYAPQEQYAGISQFSPKYDVYALGALLLYLLSGKNPPDAFQISPSQNELKQLFPDGVSEATRELVLKAMKSSSFERTPDTSTLVNEIDAAIAALSSATSVQTPTPVTPIAIPTKRKKSSEIPAYQQEAAEQLRRQAEEKARREAEEKARKEAEAQEKARREAEEKARKEAEAQEKARRAAEEKARKEADAQEKARRAAEEKARKEAEAQEKARRAAEEKARKEAEAQEKARIIAAEKARKEAEAQEKARRTAEEKARKEAEAQEKARRAAEEKARKEAERKAKKEEEERAKAEAAHKKAEAKETVATQPFTQHLDSKSNSNNEPLNKKKLVIIGVASALVVIFGGLLYFNLSKEGSQPKVINPTDEFEDVIEPIEDVDSFYVETGQTETSINIDSINNAAQIQADIENQKKTEKEEKEKFEREQEQKRQQEIEREQKLKKEQELKKEQDQAKKTNGALAKEYYGAGNQNKALQTALIAAESESGQSKQDGIWVLRQLYNNNARILQTRPGDKKRVETILGISN